MGLSTDEEKINLEAILNYAMKNGMTRVCHL